MQLFGCAADHYHIALRRSFKGVEQTRHFAAHKLGSKVLGGNIDLAAMPELANLDQRRLNQIDQHILKWINGKGLADYSLSGWPIKACQTLDQLIGQALKRARLATDWCRVGRLEDVHQEHHCMTDVHPLFGPVA